MSQNVKKDTLTVNQREKISEDGDSPSHFFGTIWSLGVASDEASTLRCSALFHSDMPDSMRSRFRHLTALCWRPRDHLRMARSVDQSKCYFPTIRPIKFTESSPGKRVFTLRQRAAACPGAPLSPCQASPAGPVPGLWSAKFTPA